MDQLALVGQNTSNADFNLALCNATKFESGTFGNRENLIPETAEGIGVTHSKAVLEGVYWQDLGDADGVSERTEGPSSLNIGAGRGLVVGRIDWGADHAAPETLTLYAPGTDMILGAPILDAWSSPALDQSQFDMIAVQFKDTAQCDEIRFAATYSGVAFGTVGSAPTDYDTWTANWPGADLTDPDADWDGDGLSNNAERHWGLHPGSNTSTNPVSLSATAGSFSYTRRDVSLTALNYTVWISTDMQNWTLDYGAIQTSGGGDAGGTETVDVTLSPHLLDHNQLFLQVGASE